MDYSKYPGQRLEKYRELLNKDIEPVVSIITPYYNSGNTIDETYNSIMNQTYPFFEWVIVDDGSTDKKSISKLNELKKKDKRIKVFTKENAGPSEARDYGVANSSKSTKYLLFIDSDDLVDKTLIECLYWSLETNEEASFAYTTTVNFGKREFIWDHYFTVEREKTENLLTVCTMIKKEDFLEVGGFGIKEKSMYEDWNLWLKLIKIGKKPLRVNAPLFWYRQTQSGEFSRAQENNEQAMKYIKETAKDIDDNQLEAIQYPRYGDSYAMVNEYDMILPDYEKSEKTTVLYIFPWMVVGGADFFNLDLIKRLPQDKYESIVLTTTPSETGYTYKGYKYRETTIIDGKNILPNTKHLFTEDATLTVVKEGNKYHIAYDYDGGSRGTENPTEITYDEIATITHPAKTGYDFTGWDISNFWVYPIKK